MLRLVGSIKAGHVAPSVMLRKLAAYERQNQLDVALQEIGKIERTLFMLDWLENPDLRRRCHAGLNNSEQRHALTQAIYTFRQGRIICNRLTKHTNPEEIVGLITGAIDPKTLAPEAEAVC